jgi:hypothetical protein
MKTLIEGAMLAVIVVFIFLSDWRATLISALALPLSVIPTFWAMSMLGFSLNLVSLLALTLVTGILVDDAIVEIENIVRHQRMGKSPYRAALEPADEIGLAVIAITFTIVAVFAPVSFMGGIAGQYFKQFGLVVRGRGADLAACRAPSHAHAGRVFPARPRPCRRARRLHHARLYARGRLVGAPPFPHLRVGLGLFAARSWRPGRCLRASSRRRTSTARSSWSSCRRARGSTTPRR